LNAVERIAGPAKNFEPLMTKLAADLLITVRKNFSKQGRPIPWKVSRRVQEGGGNRTLIQNGLLLNSISRRFTGFEAIVSTSHPQAAIHNFGGVIRPRNAKALTVPISKLAYGKRAGDFPKGSTFLLKREGKAPLIMLKPENKDGELEALFVLLKSVTIPRRDFMTPPEEDYAGYEARIVDWMGSRL
jgi:phage gpG-like protein